MPRAPKRCGWPHCDERTTARTYCTEHQAAHAARLNWGRGGTRAWRAVRARILERDPQCRLSYDGCTIRSTEVDHIQPRAEGGSDEDSNLEGACHPCHETKTKGEAARGRARAWQG